MLMASLSFFSLYNYAQSLQILLGLVLGSQN